MAVPVALAALGAWAFLSWLFGDDDVPSQQSQRQSRAYPSEAPSSRFKTLLGQVSPTVSEIREAESHARSIQRRLDSSFGLVDFHLIGSHSRETAIRTISDADFLAVFPSQTARHGNRMIRSNTFMNKIRQDLDERFWQTHVKGSQQAIVVNFRQGGRSVDLVPGIFHGVGANRMPVYRIPDGLGGWMLTSPQAHGRFIKNADERSRGKQRRTVQLLKLWRHARNPSIPLQSFHAELAIADSEVAVGVKSYSECLRDAFGLLARRNGAGLRDPIGIAGIVPATKTDAQRKRLTTACQSAYQRALKAVDAETDGNYQEAWRLWDLIFNRLYAGGRVS